MPELLSMEGVSAGYGGSIVIEDVSLSLSEGETLAVLGRNGVGKTTLLRTALGLTRKLAGAVLWCGRDLSASPAFARVRLGLGWVPQERSLFRSLTVEEHLTAVARPGQWTVSRVLELLPLLEGKRRNLGDQLSGGEQQMLAIGRALAVNPRLLLLDEPLEGLAPVVAHEIARLVVRLQREAGLAVVLVEQHAKQALAMTANAIILDRGKVVHRGTSSAVSADEDLMNRWLSVTQEVEH